MHTYMHACIYVPGPTEERPGSKEERPGSTEERLPDPTEERLAGLKKDYQD